MNRADVLTVIAHPDDEIFVGGTLCLLAERGFSTAIVSVTAGQGAGGDMAPAQLAALRTGELQCSAQALGVGQVTILGHADVADPMPVWDDERLVSQLTAIMVACEPQLILTHGPRGGYGHPAHQRTHAAVMAAAAPLAIEVCGFAARLPGAFFTWHLEGTADIVVDVREFADRRAASLSCHHSQRDYFLQPHPPRSLRKLASALAGYLLGFSEWGRKRVPLGSAQRFFARYPFEGLLALTPDRHGLSFFKRHFADDHRIQAAG